MFTSHVVSSGRALRLFLVITVSLLLLSSVATAQILSGTLSGSITDPTDAVIPNAIVTVTDLGTGKEYKETTDAAGAFTITNIPNGFFKVTVEHAGFAKAQVDSVQVYVSQTAHVNIKLEVAKTGTEVVVQAEQQTVQADSVELKNSVDREAIMEMPLPTRNPLDLVKVTAGIVTPNTTSITAGDAFVHGLRGSATNLTQDGINVQDNTVKTSSFFAISAPIVDSIGEFNVSVGGVGSDAGFGAAQVSMVTQRGTNDFHGSLFWYQRTDALNANTWFNNASNVARPFQLQNQIGVSAGGPVVIPKVYNGKNKTWIFGVFEAYREPRSQPRERTVMTTSAEQGLFTYMPTTGGGPTTVNLLNVGTINGAPAQINSALMGFYQKIVPQSGYTDAGCSGGDGINLRCVALNLAGTNNINYYTLRADHQLTSKHSIEFVWNRSSYNTAPDFLNSNEPEFANSPFQGGQLSSRNVYVWALQSVLSATQTNEFRVGYQNAPVQFAYGYQFAGEGGNEVSYAGVTNPVEVATNLPQGRNTPVRQVLDNYAWVKGNHQIRFGGEFRQVVATSFAADTTIPVATLGTNSANPNGLSLTTLPGISSAELALANDVFANITGQVASIAQGFNHTSASSGFVPNTQENYTPVINNMAFYVQDSWKMKRNFTAQYGVRWEYQGPYNARDGLVLQPQSRLTSEFGPTPVDAYFQPGNTNGATDSLLTLQGGSNNNPYGPTYKRPFLNFAPFVGLAYSPGNDGKTVLRGSFAIHYIPDGLTFYDIATTGNSGLFTTVSNNTTTGVYNVSGGNQFPTPPVSQFPVSQKNVFAGNTAANEIAFDPSLRTPYVMEWSFGIQRELWKKLTLEARYVGNHAVELYREWSVNELDVTNNGVLQAFQAAQNNLAINTANKVNSFADNGLPGQTPTPLFDKIFAGLPASSGYGNSSFITDLQQNQLGAMFSTGSTNIRRSATYAPNIAANFPLNFFVANPWANNAYYINNASWSTFNGLEVELNRRFTRSGFVLQANYTYSKALADQTAAESQTEGQNYQSILNTSLDKYRAGFDVRDSIGASFLYPLPLGKGRLVGGNSNRFTNAIIGGWNLNGFTHWSTGAPYTVSSGYVTTGSGLTTTAVIQNLTGKQLQNDMGVFERPTGVYFLNPNSGLFNITGKTSTPVFCTAGETTPCFQQYPGDEQLGNTSYNEFSGPHFFDQDLSMVKNTKIFERLNFQIRLEAFDVFNHPIFAGPSSTLASTTFGQLTSTFDTARGGGVTARIVQWAAKVTW